MAWKPGNGLPGPDEFQAAQEHMNNVTAAQAQPHRPVQDSTRLGLDWRKNLKDHYLRMKKRIPSCRRDFVIEALDAVPVDDGKRLRLPNAMPDGKHLKGDRAGTTVDLENFRIFLADETEVGESVLRNKVFSDRKRPQLDYVEMLLQRLGKRSMEDYGRFGWYPKAVDLRKRKNRLQMLFEEKWGCTSLNGAAPYLLLASSTMDNVKTRQMFLAAEDSSGEKTDLPDNVPDKIQVRQILSGEERKQLPPILLASTAFHIIIALGNTPQKWEELYHLFAMEPILPEDRNAWGEADGVVKLSAEVFDSLHQMLGKKDPEYGSAQFFRILYTMLKNYDAIYKANYYSQLFRQENYELYTVPIPGEEGWNE